MESDTALDAEIEVFDIAGIPLGEADYSEGEIRTALEAHLPELLAWAAQGASLGNLCVVEKLLRCFLDYPNRLSVPHLEAVRLVVAEIPLLDPAEGQDLLYPHVRALVPDYDRALAYQVLATQLMRYGCAMTDVVRMQLQDGLFNCEELAMALDSRAGKYFEKCPQHQDRFDGRMAAIEALWQALAQYDLRGGVPHYTAARGLLEVIAGLGA